MPRRHPLDKYTLISELGTVVLNVLRRGTLVIAAVAGAMTIWLLLQGAFGATAFAYMAIGLCICLVIWQTGGVGLPLVPMIALQHFIIYALPIFNHNETIRDYPEDLVTSAGVEVLIFLVSMGVSWYAGMNVMQLSKGFSYPISVFDQKGNLALKKLGIGLVIGTNRLRGLGPRGNDPNLHRASAVGHFLHLLGDGQCGYARRIFPHGDDRRDGNREPGDEGGLLAIACGQLRCRALGPIALACLRASMRRLPWAVLVERAPPVEARHCSRASVGLPSDRQGGYEE